ncbi:hypothetical protein GLIP_0170 [Aliiglaciecola lipolytica E3]|uniref:Uncharacterized protein n=1 Tax=Aliiglaciecola lipolytica E3 TaxID=1127673 RepID=K6WWM4_9ALTE|nr:hypothetical protein GLIP_0170 [Aliiglaciecola lipolytica E3]
MTYFLLFSLKKHYEITPVPRKGLHHLIGAGLIVKNCTGHIDRNLNLFEFFLFT